MCFNLEWYLNDVPLVILHPYNNIHIHLLEKITLKCPSYFVWTFVKERCFQVSSYSSPSYGCVFGCLENFLGTCNIIYTGHIHNEIEVDDVAFII